MAKYGEFKAALKDNTPVVIRTATDDDAENLLEHMRVLLNDGAGMIVSFDEMKKTVEEEKAWIRDLNNNQDNLLLILCFQDEIIGNIDFHANKRTTLAHNGWFGMGIKPQWRGKGAGGILLDALISWAKSNPRIEKISLSVRADNEQGIRLYTSREFKEEGRHYRQIKFGENNYVDDISMALWLGSKSDGVEHRVG
jgi:RimJ/RimL family protein N-acetyltransferase